MKKTILKIGFLIYCIFMLYILFLSRSAFSIEVYDSYSEALRSRMNLIPLETIKNYNMAAANDFVFLETAIYNVIGNVVVFIPCGVFIPALFRSQRRYYKVFIKGMITVCIIEITQLFTLLGSCDVDDLILNMLGITIGYIIFLAGMKILNKRRKAD